MARLKRVLWYLLGGTRGGPTRVRILAVLRERPFNTNQLANLLEMDYKTIQHHLGVLVENNVLSSTGQDYGAVYLPTPAMEESWEAFDEIIQKVDVDIPEEPEEMTDG